ncbi:GTPase [sulfur-oxidizing endosymbiont of Gigantopelta aegis]|uniref:GTPase n=1 Tax=sulfur-oxidizing endosymbiont of Gigantopelta aegis TaxID=2794934 RepID=UPI0018DBAB3D|nr:GTPase [sulfur-oxidizing endosymbiont of Gigantopelta aegis]
MKLFPSSRLLIAIALTVLFFIFLVAILFVTNLSFSVWEQLQQKPLWLIWTYASAIAFACLVFGGILWRLLLPKKKQQTKTANKSPQHIDIKASSQRLDALNEKISSAQEKELATIQSALAAELQEYAQRKDQQSIYIALFGDISSGKSSLIKALTGEASIASSVLGGTTKEVVHYQWSLLDENKTSHDVVLTDMPGLNEQFSELDSLASEEVLRAHIVIYCCDGDLTASQWQELQPILSLAKPCIVALNKADQYQPEELALIIERIQQRIQAINSAASLVTMSAGGTREFIRLTPDGEEERVQRPLPIDVNDLRERVSQLISDLGLKQLERLREISVSSLMNNKLDDLDARFKFSQSQRLVNGYTKKAVVASMATISPGTDLLVQGYLGIQMVKDLCKLYEVNATDIDANKLIELIQLRMDKSLPLLLAIAGNGLKAFPGIGTVSGGLMHAVAYGMIFDTLGRSIARTLEVTGELSPTLVSDLYKEQLGENIESRTKDFIKLVLKLRQRD